MANSNMNAARAAKNDEFYTRLVDVESEMYYYREHFRGKVIYLNCDDPYVSAFFEFFSKQFEFLGLKKLIATCYKNDGDFTLFTQKKASRGLKLVYEGGAERSLPGPGHIRATELEGDGDFRSPECIELLKEADIVVTNPPFSLFREFIATMVEHDKKFIVLGNVNAVSYREIFPLIKDNKLWLGASCFNKPLYFNVPEDFDYRDTYKGKREIDGKPVVQVNSIAWFTNLEHNRRTYPIDLYKRMDRTPEDFPKYDNYDAIEVSRVADIPEDYAGVMGVPLTFLGNFCPDQFEIVSGWKRGRNVPNPGAERIEVESKGKKLMWNGPALNGRPLYFRILIRHKNPRVEGY